MPLPVIPDVWQVRLIWTNPNAPRAASNTFHVEDPTGLMTAQQIFTFIDGDVTNAMWGVVGAGSVVTQVQLTPLDGVTAGTTFATGGAAKWQGQGTADLILQGSAVVSLKSARRGPAGRNRLYLPWVGEGNQLNGVLTGGGFDSMAAAWTAFLAALDTDGIDAVVVSPSLDQAFPVASSNISSSLRTQRRRTRR